MPSYLKLEVGPYYLLVPTNEVFEVLTFDRHPGEDGYVVWRDQILPSVSMRQQLGLPDDGDGVMIVHAEGDATHSGLIVDKVMGLVELQEADFQPVHVRPAKHVRFDQVWSDRETGRQALKVRVTAGQGRDQCSESPLTVP